MRPIDRLDPIEPGARVTRRKLRARDLGPPRPIRPPTEALPTADVEEDNGDTAGRRRDSSRQDESTAGSDALGMSPTTQPEHQGLELVAQSVGGRARRDNVPRREGHYQPALSSKIRYVVRD